MANGEDIKSSSHYLLKCASKKGGLHRCDEIKHFRPTLLWAKGWVENLPVAERALQIWPNILKYVAAVRTKDVHNPATSSFDTIEVAAKDPFVIAKLEFFTAVCRTVSPFLTRYQTDEPVLPFIAHDLAELLKVSDFLCSCCKCDLNN